jgi:hypothetical protein
MDAEYYQDMADGFMTDYYETCEELNLRSWDDYDDDGHLQYYDEV